MQYTDDMLQNYIPETYVILLLTSVTPNTISRTKERNKKKEKVT